MKTQWRMDWNRRTHIPGQFCEGAVELVKGIGLILLAAILFGAIAIIFGWDE